MFDSERDDSPEHLGKALPKNTKISTFRTICVAQKILHVSLYNKCQEIISDKERIIIRFWETAHVPLP